MDARRYRALLSAIPALLLMATAGCSSRDLDSLSPAPSPSNSEVYIDGFVAGLEYQSFGGSKLDALEIDETGGRGGSSSLKFTVPVPGDRSGSFAGGVFVGNPPRNLSGYTALTFWARGRQGFTMNTAGFGNDNTGASMYTAEAADVRIGTSWTKVILPFPLASKLTAERGFFHFAEGAENNQGNEFWIDDLQFEDVGTIANVRPAIASATITGEVGDAASVMGTTVTFDVAGEERVMNASSAYFTFASSDPGVVTVDHTGRMTFVGLGMATVTASLGLRAASGAVTVDVGVSPDDSPATPTVDAANVISLFSDAYADRTVDTWSAEWDQADVADVQIGGDNAKKYTNLVFAGVEFTSAPVDASDMTHFHIDIWTSDRTAAPAAFQVKLVDFGGGGTFGGGDDSEHELSLTAESDPPLATGQWISYDIPIADFAGLAGRTHLAQMIFSGDPNTVYVDNVYFWRDVPSAPTAPEVAAPVPTQAVGDVTSLFSDAYDDAMVDTWSADWDQADVEDVMVAGDAVKKYTNLVFAGIEFTSAPVDASDMTHFAFDLWTPDPTADPASVRVKLVDFGADGAFAGGDDTEHEMALTAASNPPLATGSWVSYNLPLADFTGLAARASLAQLIISADPNTIFVDNVRFWGGGAPTEPEEAAPVPTRAAGDVTSLFSDAYDDATVDTWSADWDQADVEDVMVAGDAVKKYSNLAFAGIEFTSAPIDASDMTHFHIDIWTPDPTAAPAVFKVKLVDFGANGSFQGGDDSEHEMSLTAESDPPLATGSWVSYDLPLADFTGLAARASLAQLIISGDPNTVYVDNLYFWR